jgi:hypothetical protein
MSDDWFEVLVALEREGARFLVIGAHALALYGVPRGTQDLDVWVDPEPANAERVWRALVRFGAPLATLDVSVADLSMSGQVIQIGVPPNRIDVLTSVTGVPSFADAWTGRLLHPVRGQPMPFLGRDALVATKRATGRLKDQADLEALGEPLPER